MARCRPSLTFCLLLLGLTAAIRIASFASTDESVWGPSTGVSDQLSREHGDKAANPMSTTGPLLTDSSRDANSTWPSGHRIIFVRHALSVSNHFGLVQSNMLTGLMRVWNAAKDSCRDTCACLPYNHSKAGSIIASCNEIEENFGDWTVVIRDSLLSSYGMQKAIRYGDRLRKILSRENVSIKKFLISPMRRTLQTAVLLFRHMMADNVEVIPNLHEAYLSLSDLAYDGEVSWYFLEALQAHFKEERTVLIPNVTMNKFKEQLTSVRYADLLAKSYEIDTDGYTAPEKIKSHFVKMSTEFSQFFQKRMAELRSKLLSMAKGTYVIVSHGGIGQFFFPGYKLANLATIIGELNGNEKADQMFHSFEQLRDWSAHARKAPGWRMNLMNKAINKDRNSRN